MNLNFQQLKSLWLLSSTLDNDQRDLEQYIKELYRPVYDEHLDFLGWTRKDTCIEHE